MIMCFFMQIEKKRDVKTFVWITYILRRENQPMRKYMILKQLTENIAIPLFNQNKHFKLRN